MKPPTQRELVAVFLGMSLVHLVNGNPEGWLVATLFAIAVHPFSDWLDSKKYARKQRLK